MSTDDFIYGVFLSYRQQEPDKSWVRKTLLPRLEAEGLRACVDYRDFRLGAPMVMEMARAVVEPLYPGRHLASLPGQQFHRAGE